MRSLKIISLVVGLPCLTDNNPLTYIRTSRLGAAQICWLSDLALFDFEIKYRAGKSNQVADALSRHPSNPDSLSESSDDDEEWETISYGMVCQIIDHHLESTKLPYHLHHEVQTNVTDVDVANRSLGFSQFRPHKRPITRGETL